MECLPKAEVRELITLSTLPNNALSSAQRTVLIAQSLAGNVEKQDEEEFFCVLLCFISLSVSPWLVRGEEEEEEEEESQILCERAS